MTYFHKFILTDIVLKLECSQPDKFSSNLVYNYEKRNKCMFAVIVCSNSMIAEVLVMFWF